MKLQSWSQRAEIPVQDKALGQLRDRRDFFAVKYSSSFKFEKISYIEVMLGGGECTAGGGRLLARKSLERSG